MREIKFRAWNIKECKMWEASTIQEISERWCFSKDSLVIEQFTGLKDINGVDIYEGDILYYSNDFGKTMKAKIFYKEGGLCFNVHDNDFNKSPDKIYFYESCADMQSKGWITQFEIIGNIHENKN